MKRRTDINFPLTRCFFFNETGDHVFIAKIFMPPREGETVRYKSHTQPTNENVPWTVVSVTHVFSEGNRELSHYTIILRSNDPGQKFLGHRTEP